METSNNSSMPSLSQTSSVESSNNQENNSDENAGGLNPPVHESDVKVEDPKPIVNSVEETVSTNVKLPLQPKGGIEVVATRVGFYGQHRKKEGDKFTVSSFSKLGEWMSCVCIETEKKRKAYFVNKNKRR